MLAIRMQRTGRKKQAHFRVIVQEAHLTPTSGRVVAHLGSYNPHTKQATLDSEKATFYLNNGAQPSDRVAKLLQSEKVKLPDWVKIIDNQERKTKSPDKLRKNQPKEETPVAEESPAAEEPAADTETASEEKPKEEAPAAEESAEEPTEEAPAEAEQPKESEPETPAEESAEDKQDK